MKKDTMAKDGMKGEKMPWAKNKMTAMQPSHHPFTSRAPVTPLTRPQAGRYPCAKTPCRFEVEMGTKKRRMLASTA
jgi:hypothetical protein